MSDETEYDFFKLRKQAKTYISKVFSFSALNRECGSARHFPPDRRPWFKALRGGFQ
jgi:hypothetical protein